MAFNQFEQSCLERHNKYRAKHGSPALILNRELCEIAQRWADHLASRQVLEHSQNRQMSNGQITGENLYMSSSPSQGLVSADGATDSWYGEIDNYNWNNQGFSMKTGHFTQVVWRGTSMLGVASATYKKGSWYNTIVVANYSPPGNYPGQFEGNVPRLL